MAFNYDVEYKNRIRTYIHSIKNSKSEKDTNEGKEISERKKESLKLLERIHEFGYKPHAPNCSFFVTESKAGFNQEGLSRLEQLEQINLFLVFYLNERNK